MQIIIPMSGRGSRFERAGYKKIKPLIEVEGKPIIEHIVGLFPTNSDFLFICAEDHLKSTDVKKVLKRIAPNGKIVAIAPHKLGPVHTVLAARQHIDPAKAALVSYCDYSLRWDFADFARTMKASGCTASIPSYRGFHPHSLGPNLYAYLRTDGKKVVEIKEKGAFTNDRMNEYASAGLYYFKSGAHLTKYFQAAMDQGLKTNGEFYASLPMNLVIQDGEPVDVYELTQFMQWGTPEDLEEYVAWSDYFLNGEDSAFVPPSGEGTVLIPMAGLGERFQKQGYTQPKPLVPVDGVPMLKRVLTCLPKLNRRVLVCRGELEMPLRREKITGEGDVIVTLGAPTDGAVTTCQAARERIDPRAPLFIAACDSAYLYSSPDWKKLAADTSVDFAVVTFLNHPHANRNPKQYAWVQTNVESTIVNFACKAPLSETPAKDPGVIGSFWFRRASDFFDAADELKARDLRVNGEFYVDSVVSLLREKGLKGKSFPVESFLCFGTPDDVRTYEYWADYFRHLKSVKPSAKKARGAKR